MPVLVRGSTTLAAIAAAVVLAAQPSYAAPAPGGPQSAPVTWDTTVVEPGNVWVTDLASDAAGRLTAVGSRLETDGGGMPVGAASIVLGRGPAGQDWRQTRLEAGDPWTTLEAVDSAATPGRTVAVGRYDAKLGGFFTAREQHGVWQASVAPAPSGTEVGVLKGIDVRRPDDAWAVGASAVRDASGVLAYQPVAEHWDGSSWRVVPLPPGEFGIGPVLESVAAVAADDVWAGGGAFGPQPLLAHYDGEAWQWVPLPFQGSEHFASITNLLARSADDVWALGWSQDQDFQARPLVFHYDGRSWSQQSVPPGVQRFLDAVLTPGGFAATTMEDAGHGVVRLDGGTWTPMPLPRTGEVLQDTGGITYAHGRLSVMAMVNIDYANYATVEYAVRLPR